MGVLLLAADALVQNRNVHHQGRQIHMGGGPGMDLVVQGQTFRVIGGQ